MPKLKKRPDGRYQKSITINGKRHFFYGKTESEINRKILNYHEKEANGPTFEEIADAWYENIENAVSPATYKRYKPCKERAVSHFGEMYIKDIDVVLVNNYIISFAAQQFAQKTVKSQLSIVSLIFKYAILHGFISTNPCQYVSVPKGLSKKFRELPSDDEITKVRNGLSCTFGLFAYFILFTGLRRGEALALKYGDIDYNNKTVNVTKSLMHDNGKPVITKPKTEAGNRTVILPDCLYNVLPKNKSAEEIIFPNSSGEYMHGTNFTRIWKKYQNESGVTVTPHQLRHAYATLLFDAGLQDKDAQELLGHTTIAMTRDIYTHISQGRRNAAAHKLNDFVNSSKNI